MASISSPNVSLSKSTVAVNFYFCFSTKGVFFFSFSYVECIDEAVTSNVTVLMAGFSLIICYLVSPWAKGKLMTYYYINYDR